METNMNNTYYIHYTSYIHIFYTYLYKYFTHDPILVVSVPDDRDFTIKIWDVNKGECLQTLEGHTGEVRSLIKLRDGSIVSGSWDGTIKVCMYVCMYICMYV